MVDSEKLLEISNMLKSDLSKAMSSSMDDAVFREHVQSLPFPNGNGAGAGAGSGPSFDAVSAQIRENMLASSLSGAAAASSSSSAYHSSSSSSSYRRAGIDVSGLDSVPERDTANLG